MPARRAPAGSAPPPTLPEAVVGDGGAHADVADVADAAVADAALRCLFEAGLVARAADDAGPDRLWVILPRSSAFLASLEAGRKELVGLLRKRRYHEMPRVELTSRGLRRTHLSVQFHVRDAVGAGLVQLVPTPAGEFVRLAARLL